MIPKPNSAVIVRRDDAMEGDKATNIKIDLLTDHAFAKAFDDSSKSLHNTKHFQSVQTCVKSTRGIGEPFIIKFYAPLNLSDPSEKIEYNYRKLGDDVELIQTDEFKYCQKQCYKIAYFLSKLHDIEILRMQCEFLKDENKTIWFSYADQIAFRRIKTKNEDHLAIKQIQYINKDHQAQLLKQLDAHRVK